MTHVHLQWTPTGLATLIADGYDRQRVERDPGAGYVSMMRSDQLMPLVSHVETYVFEDPAGDTSWDYRVVYVKSSDGTEHPTPQAIGSVTAFGYCTVSDIRDEGWDATDVTDAQVEQGIALATAYIEKKTRQWFVPRYRRIVLDGSGWDRLFVQVPIVALMEVYVDGVTEGVGNLHVYNRHLTHGLTDPDDRENPMIAFDEALNLTSFGYQRMNYGFSAFEESGKIVELVGIFGCTELPPGTQPGETSAGSQVPLSYGATPPLIEWAAIRLAMMKMFPANSDNGDGGALARRIVEEKTMDQSVKYASSSASGSTVGEALWNDEAAVREILNRYAAPLGLEVI